MKVTIAPHAPASLPCTMLTGQVPITGDSGSVTVTVKVQALVLSLVSVAVQVTTVAPFGKAAPLGGAQSTLAPQLSLAVGAL